MKKHTSKKILALALALLMLVTTALFAFAKGETVSGQCGENAFWSFDADNATLTISGTGAIDDYVEYNAAGDLEEVTTPWNEYAYAVSKVTIEPGITRIGDGAFALFHGLKQIEIPDTVTSIGDYAFVVCISLESIDLPTSLKTIGNYAFGDCVLLRNMVVPEGVETIGHDAFNDCFSLRTLSYPSTLKTIETNGEYLDVFLAPFLYKVTNYSTEVSWMEATQFSYSVLFNEKDEAFNAPIWLKFINIFYYQEYAQAALGKDADEQEYLAFYCDMFDESFADMDAFRAFVDGTSDADIVSEMKLAGETEEEMHENTSFKLYCYENSADHQWIIENAPLIPYAFIGTEPVDETVTFVDEDTNISITYDTDAFAPEVEIIVTEVPTGDDNSRAWNITPTLNGEKVQPNKPVQVKLPIPAGWDKDNIVLIHYLEDGTEEYPPFTIEGDFVVFMADSFSKYALESVPPHVHTYDAGVVTTQPSCTQAGVKTFTCVDGDHSYTESVDPLGHLAPDSNGICPRCNQRIADPQPNPNACPVCQKVHNGNFFDRIVGFFHRIFYTLTHLFQR